MQTKWMKWERQPDIRGWGAAIAHGEDVVAEATVVRTRNRRAVYDVFGSDGLDIVASGEARTVAAAKKMAEHEMRCLVVRPA